MSRVRGRHHVLSVEHLLGQLGHGAGAVLLRAPRHQRREPGHEEVEAGEGNHVDGELSQVGVQLPWEPQASGDTGHCERDEMVEIAISGCGQL